MSQQKQNNNYILLTIDVEDWFQVENFKQWIPYSSWSSRELRVEKNTHQLLDLFDTSVSARNSQQVESPTNASNPNNTNNPTNPSNQATPKATFFILGWLAERLPHLVREIHSRGHEVASHGYHHEIFTEKSYKNFKKDLIDSKKLLEDIIGTSVTGYRAPNFSINSDFLKIIEDCGYLYDSSYNSFAMHGRYGKISLNGKSRFGIAYRINSDFYELPISNLKFKIQNLELPWGGGGYFRLIPYPIFKHGVQTILKNEKAYLIYLHPWEVDPQQPRVQKASAGYKFRHYTNLNKTHSKLSALIKSFSHCNFVTCQQYLKQITNSSEIKSFRNFN